MKLGPHLLIQVNQGFIRQLEGLDGLQDGVPVTAVNVSHEALDAVHRVQRHCGLLLQAEQGSVQVVLLEVLHDQTNHAKEEEVTPTLWSFIWRNIKMSTCSERSH